MRLPIARGAKIWIIRNTILPKARQRRVTFILICERNTSILYLKETQDQKAGYRVVYAFQGDTILGMFL